MTRWTTLASAAALALVGACGRATSEPTPGSGESSSGGDTVPSVPVGSIPGHGSIKEDRTQKEGPRLIPAETYIRSYLLLFGGLAPIDVQTAAKGKDGAALFDVWADYVAALGLPDYKNEISRSSQTNALMVATFERLGVALCDRAVERDLRGKTPLDKRVVFAFEPTAGPPSDKAFAERFDVLHRTFLGYPAADAPTDRTNRFMKLYRDVVARHSAPKAEKSAFKPAEAGWANVCYGLVRHPEFHVY